MPLYRKLPKRGFKNPNRQEYDALNVGRLGQVEAPELTPEVLKARRLVSGKQLKYKVLGQGEITRPCVVFAHAFSKTARDKIEAAGGRCEVIK